MYASYINLLFPLNILMEFVLTAKTNRKYGGIDFDFANEAILFTITIWAMYDMNGRFLVYNDQNRLHSKELDDNQLMAATIVWNMFEKSYPFEWLLAILSINTWIKLLVRM